MSIDMLGLNALEKHQTIEDDMESLLYVVLYCSFLWLPHGLSTEQLATTFREFFEWSDLWVNDTILVGGEGKVKNALYRSYTKAAGFGQDLKEWLDAVMELRWPDGLLEVLEVLEERSDGVVEETEKWTNPNHLDTFWAEFLQTHNLPNDDRVVHDHPHATGIYGGEHAGSTEAISFHKRPSEEQVESSAPPPKKSRITRDAPSGLVRRSERLRDRQGGVKVPPAVPKRRQPPRSVKAHAHPKPKRTIQR